MCGDRGGPHIDGDAIGMLAKSGPDRNDLAAAMHRHGYLPMAFAQRLLQLLQDAHVAGQIGQTPLEFERVFEAAQIARRVVHVGFLHFDEVQANHRVEFDVMRLGRLAHHLAMHLAGRRHVDHGVAEQARGAGQPAPSLHRHGLAVFLLDLAKGTEVLRARNHAMLGEFALGQQHLTAPAQAAPAEDRIDIDSQGARRLQNRRAHGKAATPS